MGFVASVRPGRTTVARLWVRIRLVLFNVRVAVCVEVFVCKILISDSCDVPELHSEPAFPPGRLVPVKIVNSRQQRDQSGIKAKS